MNYKLLKLISKFLYRFLPKLVLMVGYNQSARVAFFFHSPLAFVLFLRNAKGMATLQNWSGGELSLEFMMAAYQWSEDQRQGIAEEKEMARLKAIMDTRRN